MGDRRGRGVERAQGWEGKRLEKIALRISFTNAIEYFQKQEPKMLFFLHLVCAVCLVTIPFRLKCLVA